MLNLTGCRVIGSEDRLHPKPPITAISSPALLMYRESARRGAQIRTYGTPRGPSRGTAPDSPTLAESTTLIVSMQADVEAGGPASQGHQAKRGREAAVAGRTSTE